MKRFLTLRLIIGLAAPVFAQDGGEERRPTRIDRNHSTLGFRIPIVYGLGTVTGKFTDWSVELYWDADDLENSSVNVEIQGASVDTGIENRDSDIRSDNMLNVEAYPTITFESSSIVGGPAEFDVMGTFTMLGVSKEVTLNLAVNTYEDPADGYVWTAFRVYHKLDRTDYGMTWKHGSVDFFVGDEIETDIILITR